jgi:signal transduction histidine kinase
MRLRARLMVLSVSTVAIIVTVLFALHLDSLTVIWLNNALDRNTDVGKLIQKEIENRIIDKTSEQPNATLAQTIKTWGRIVTDDKELADMLVDQSAIRGGVIIEINIIDEYGSVILSSNPSRQGQDAPHREDLKAVLDSGFLGRLTAITASSTDYESRKALGTAEQPKVFDIQLLVSPVLFRDRLRGDLRQTAVASLFALLAAVFLAVVSANFALRPVRRIGRAIDTLATGRPLGLTVPGRSQEDREIAAIEEKLSLLGDRMQGAKRDADQARSAIGKLVRGVAHEIRNPLNAISLRLEGLRIRIADEIPEAEADVDLVSNEVHRLDRVVKTFLDLNRPLELDIKQFDPGELASQVLETMRPAAEQVHVGLELVRPPQPFFVKADRGLIEQGLINIVNNAIQALGNENNGHGLIRTSISASNGNCEIAVSDNGPGIPENVKERIFEPYFTTKSGGSGVGLAFTRRAMDFHQGQIIVNTAPGGGTTMVLSFPMVRS